MAAGGVIAGCGETAGAERRLAVVRPWAAKRQQAAENWQAAEIRRAGEMERGREPESTAATGRLARPPVPRPAGGCALKRRLELQLIEPCISFSFFLLHL